MQFSKKVQTNQYEPEFFMAEIDAADLGILLEGSDARAQLAGQLLMTLCQKMVWLSMHDRGLIEDVEYNAVIASLMPDQQVEEGLRALQVPVQKDSPQ